jgi:hypothetical protein
MSAGLWRTGGDKEEPVTPFMLKVQALLDGGPAPSPDTEPSRSSSVAVAADTQVIFRSLAEQLVSEANAVLREHGDIISLADECGPGDLAFTLGYRDRAARVQTRLTGRTAVGRLVIGGETDDGPRQLATADEVQALRLSLLAGTRTAEREETSRAV